MPPSLSRVPHGPVSSSKANRRDFLRFLGLEAGLLSPGMLAGQAPAEKGKEQVTRARGRRGMVWTVKGPVPSARLGATLMHEHVLFGDIPAELRATSVELAVKLLKDAARVGIDTLVDLTPIRDIQLYQQIAEQVPVQIIPSTGSYVYGRMPKAIQSMNEDQMYERMLREVSEGIDGTKIRAGIIKVAAGRLPFSDWEKSAFRAAARVNKAVGTPIGTHAIFEPRAQLEVLMEAGADPNQCFFSHIEAEFGWGGRTLQQMADYLLSIAKDGGYLLFNNFGFEFDTPWPDLVFLIRYLCDKGHANRVFTAVDCNWEWKKGQIVFEASEKHPETAKRTYAWMITDAVPEMLKAGFSAKEVQTFLVDNPRRFFRGA